MAIGWLAAIYWLIMSWLWAGYQLYPLTAYVPKSIHFKHINIYYVPKWHMTALDCSVFTRFWGLSVGYRLAIGWLCPKINTLQDIVIYYYVPKWHMTAINTLDCIVFTRIFSWLLAGYCLFPKFNTLQDIVIYNIITLNRTSQDTGSIFGWSGFLMTWYETPNSLFFKFEPKST